MTSKITNNNISLLDVCKKNVDKKIRGVYDSTTFDSEGKVMSFNEQAAIITHYLQLKDKGVLTDDFCEKAEDLMSLWYDFCNGEPPRGDIAAEGRYYGSFFDSMIV